ncbi:MAG: hypothetical protein QG656_2695 [Candidatus Hydrogenedentes bacterium]|nr:hypothetical protein [Candidatus Hydrogenedentota bacterium]
MSLDCFPVPGGGVMKVKIGITAPLVIRGGQAYLRLPCFSGRNFTVSPELEHKVWAECKTPLSAGSEALTAERPSNDVYAVRGVLLDTELQDPKKALIWLPAPPLGGSVVTGALGAFSAAMSLYEFKKVESPAVALVVDGSVSMSRASIDWTAVVDALPPSAEILAIHAGRTVSVWKEDFTQSADGLAEWLSSQKYEGGCDPVPALEMAWERVSAKPDAAILWIHGPLPITLSPMDGMEQWYKRRPMCANGVPVRLLSLQVLPGPNRVAESFASWTGFERVPMLASVDESLAYAATHLASQDAGRSYVLTENVGEGANSLDHVVRLAVFEEVCKACRGDAAIDKDAALKRAVRTRIVTPVSGAVVLENKSQYEQHGLDPGENLNAIPVIPEPEEWALIAVAALALAVMYRKRRKVGVHNA